jgi:hypothetical protein
MPSSPRVHVEFVVDTSAFTGRVMTEIDLDRYERMWEDFGEGSPREADWFCLRIEPWCCEHCGQTLRHMTYGDGRRGHLVIVWPSRNDPNMYEVIGLLEQKAAIVPYEEAIGPSVSFYEIHPR